MFPFAVGYTASSVQLEPEEELDDEEPPELDDELLPELEDELQDEEPPEEELEVG